MDKAINYGLKRGSSFVEIREGNVILNKVEIINKETKNISTSESTTYGARVIYKNKEGYSYSTEADYTKLIDQAIKNTKLIGTNVAIKNLKPTIKKIKIKCKINPLDISLNQKKDFIIRLDKRELNPEINVLELQYFDRTSSYVYQNSEGTETEFDDTVTGFISTAHGQSDNNKERDVQLLREHCGFELKEKAEKKVDESINTVKNLLKAKLAKGGNFPVIIDQDLGGVFIHEAVGHACEADFITTNASILKDKLNKRIGSSILTVYDNGNLDSHGYTPIDSEGVIAHKTKMIDYGILKSYLQSRLTASKMNQEPTANGRSMSIANRIIPRMTNTYIDNHKSRLADMLSSVKTGYYLKGSVGGEVDIVKGEFIFSSKYGYEIKNGKLGSMVKKASLMGNILKILPNISMIANDFQLRGGMCGKNGQWIPVSTGSPHFKIEKATVGGAI